MFQVWGATWCGALVATWLLALWCDGPRIHPQLYPRPRIRASSLASKVSIRMTSLPFSPLPASLFLSGKNVLWTSWGCNPGSSEAQFLVFLLFITTWMLHLAFPILYRAPRRRHHYFMLNVWVRGGIERLRNFLKVAKSQTWDLTTLLFKIIVITVKIIAAICSKHPIKGSHYYYTN